MALCVRLCCCKSDQVNSQRRRVAISTRIDGLVQARPGEYGKASKGQVDCTAKEECDKEGGGRWRVEEMSSLPARRLTPRRRCRLGIFH